LLSIDDFIKTDLTEFELVEVIDEMLVNIPQAQIIIIFYEVKIDDKIKTNVLLYSAKNLDALNLVKEYKPEGTKNMVKFTTEHTLEETKNKILPLLENKITKKL
jgi:hypothetical protein